MASHWVATAWGSPDNWELAEFDVPVRDRVRSELIALAGNGDLVVPMARTFPLDQAPRALRMLADGHPGGKIALLPLL